MKKFIYDDLMKFDLYKFNEDEIINIYTFYQKLEDLLSEENINFTNQYFDFDLREILVVYKLTKYYLEGVGFKVPVKLIKTKDYIKDIQINNNNNDDNTDVCFKDVLNYYNFRDWDISDIVILNLLCEKVINKQLDATQINAFIYNEKFKFIDILANDVLRAHILAALNVMKSNDLNILLNQEFMKFWYETTNISAFEIESLRKLLNKSTKKEGVQNGQN